MSGGPLYSIGWLWLWFIYVGACEYATDPNPTCGAFDVTKLDWPSWFPRICDSNAGVVDTWLAYVGANLEER